jgi:cyanophycinase
MWIFPLIASFLIAADLDPPRGRIVAVGGGRTDPEFYRRIIEVSGVEAVRVVVVPHASNRVEELVRIADRWREAGVSDVTVLDPDDLESALGAIEKANIIWIRGGDQGYLMRRLEGSPIPDAIRERFRNGAIIAGTSAGAAVMSRVMIAGNDRRTDDGPRRARLGEGLGLWPGAIVDQHFTARRRFERLKGAVLEHPDLIGVGIDEGTAVLVGGDGRRFEVLGQGDVVVLDARRPRPGDVLPAEADRADPTAQTELTTHVLKAGMVFDLDEGVQPQDGPDLGN